MKKCPVCGTKYANDKEFCELDRAYLNEMSDEEAEKEALKEEEKRIPFDKKRVATACIYACAFIAGIAILVYWMSGGFNS